MASGTVEIMVLTNLPLQLMSLFCIPDSHPVAWWASHIWDFSYFHSNVYQSVLFLPITFFHFPHLSSEQLYPTSCHHTGSLKSVVIPSDPLLSRLIPYSVSACTLRCFIFSLCIFTTLCSGIGGNLSSCFLPLWLFLKPLPTLSRVDY